MAKLRKCIYFKEWYFSINLLKRVCPWPCCPSWLLLCLFLSLKNLYDGDAGFVILGRKILTNAHVVADHSFVLVRKHGCPTKYRAEVKAVGHECDLAILVIENKEFWDGMNPLELGDVPFLQEAVAVVGYPQGSNRVWINLCYIFCVVFLFFFG